MYLHLGQDTVVRTDEIIGIFDLESSSVSKITKDFLAGAEKNGQVFNVSYELPKTFVICGGRKKSTVYIAQISSATLKKRATFMEEISNIGRE